MSAHNRHAKQSRLIGAAEAAAEYGIKHSTLRDIVHRGQLPVIRFGRAWYFERTDIEKLIASAKDGGGAAAPARMS